MKTAALVLLALLPGPALTQPRVVALPGKSPLVTLRFVFRAGAAFDPPGKPGTAWLTAAMLAEAGTRQMTYKQIVDAMFPMATSVSRQVDKEMTTFSAVTHSDNLDEFYRIFRAMLLEPGWREDDLNRVRDDTINYLRVTLRGNNDEELGKEVLYNAIYEDHPYGHHNAGTVASLEKLAIEDLQRFYKGHFTQSALIIGIAGGYSPDFLERVKKDFAALPAGAAPALKLPEPKAVAGNRMIIVDKPTRSVAFSFGFPIGVRRGHPDYIPLLVAQSYFGQHRMSGGRLYDRIREIRGLNYGNYAYIEYFPNGMFQFEPDPNLVRQQQIFQVWIRPVEPPTAHFTLRLALYELDKLVKEGIPADAFEQTRSFLSKYVNLLMKTKRAELGYAIDSAVYGIPEYSAYIKAGLARLTREEVNRVIRKHLRPDLLHMAIIARDGDSIRKMLLAGEPSPMTYNAAKPKEILEEDKIVEKWPVALQAEDVLVVPVGRVFE